jgi:tetratricopeptide (TPR) repeat protein
MMGLIRLSCMLTGLSALWLAPAVFFASQQSDPSVLNRYFQEGEQALAQKRFAEAANAYEKLAQLDPKTAEVHAKLGFIYYQQGKFAQAVPAFRRALKLKPGLPNADILLALSLSELGHYAEALPSLERGFRNPPDVSVRRLLGLQLQRTYLGLQRPLDAVEVALQLCRLYPEDPEVLYHAGRVSGDFAHLNMWKLSRVAPGSVWDHQAIGEAHESQGHYDLALREYRKVLSLDPERPGIHFRIGRTLLLRPLETDSLDEVLKAFQNELMIDPTNAAAAYEMGEVHRKTGQLEKAQVFFETANKHYPDFEEARIGLARTLLASNQPEKALPHLKKALSLNSENEVSHYQLSLVYKALGNLAEQQKALEQFQLLRKQKAQHRDKAQGPPKPVDVTRQELDSESLP